MLSLPLVVPIHWIIAGHYPHPLALALQRTTGTPVGGGQGAAQTAHRRTIATTPRSRVAKVPIATLAISGQGIVALFDFDFDIEHGLICFLSECTF